MMSVSHKAVCSLLHELYCSRNDTFDAYSNFDVSSGISLIRQSQPGIVGYLHI